jgi:GNAT superfamily N-acetyltransferase
MSIVIRPLTAADEPQWRALWRDYLAFYETELPRPIYDAYFKRLLGDDPQDYHALVAEMDGTLVGLAHYLFHRHGWKVDNVCYLQDLFAAPQVRGKGVGRALIAAVYDAADKADAPGVYWLTQDTNTQARQLYDRIGTLTPFIKYARTG